MEFQNFPQDLAKSLSRISNIRRRLDYPTSLIDIFLVPALSIRQGSAFVNNLERILQSKSGQFGHALGVIGQLGSISPKLALARHSGKQPILACLAGF
jgi:hypothetical protein